MTPRRYNQARRAEAAADTRRRIIDAARLVYREVGVGAATLNAIAQRADVARGTVVNHFGSAEGLLDEVLGVIVAELRYPDERDQEGATDPEERIRRYVDAMFRFFVRSEADWPAFSRDLDHPVLRAREAEYNAAAARFYAASFGDLAGDPIVTAAVRAYVNYGPLHELRTAGLELAQAIDLVAGSLIAIARQRRESAVGGPPPGPGVGTGSRRVG